MAENLHRHIRLLALATIVISGAIIVGSSSAGAQWVNPFTDQVPSGCNNPPNQCQQMHPTQVWENHETDWYRNGGWKEGRVALHTGDNGLTSSQGRNMQFIGMQCDNLGHNNTFSFDVHPNWTWSYYNRKPSTPHCIRFKGFVEPSRDTNGWGFGFGNTTYDGKLQS